jgi:hypothetical protein
MVLFSERAARWDRYWAATVAPELFAGQPVAF